MDTQAMIEQVRKLKTALEALEKRLTAAEVPLPVLEDFKMAIDHTRMTTWAILTAPQSNDGDLSAAIVRSRLKRAMEMARQIVLDINAGELTIDSPELQQCHTTLRDTLGRIERLYRSGL